MRWRYSRGCRGGAQRSFQRVLQDRFDALVAAGAGQQRSLGRVLRSVRRVAISRTNNAEATAVANSPDAACRSGSAQTAAPCVARWFRPVDPARRVHASCARWIFGRCFWLVINWPRRRCADEGRSAYPYASFRPWCAWRGPPPTRVPACAAPVEVAVEGGVIVDVDAVLAPFAQVGGRTRQSMVRRVQTRKHAGPAAFALAERAMGELVEYFANRVQLFEREDLAATERRDDPASRHWHCALNLRFVTRLTGPRRYDAEAVLLCEAEAGRVQVGT